jgi:hypothetical protein
MLLLLLLLLLGQESFSFLDGAGATFGSKYRTKVSSSQDFYNYKNG